MIPGKQTPKAYLSEETRIMPVVKRVQNSNHIIFGMVFLSLCQEKGDTSRVKGLKCI